MPRGRPVSAGHAHCWRLPRRTCPVLAAATGHRGIMSSPGPVHRACPALGRGVGPAGHAILSLSGTCQWAVLAPVSSSAGGAWSPGHAAVAYARAIAGWAGFHQALLADGSSQRSPRLCSGRHPDADASILGAARPKAGALPRPIWTLWCYTATAVPTMPRPRVTADRLLRSLSTRRPAWPSGMHGSVPTLCRPRGPMCTGSPSRRHGLGEAWQREPVCTCSTGRNH